MFNHCKLSKSLFLLRTGVLTTRSCPDDTVSLSCTATFKTWGLSLRDNLLRKVLPSHLLDRISWICMDCRSSLLCASDHWCKPLQIQPATVATVVTASCTSKCHAPSCTKASLANVTLEVWAVPAWGARTLQDQKRNETVNRSQLYSISVYQSICTYTWYTFTWYTLTLYIYYIKISQRVVPNQQGPRPDLRLKFHGREKYQELTLLYLHEALCATAESRCLWSQV